VILLGNAASGSKQQHVSLKIVLLLCFYEAFVKILIVAGLLNSQFSMALKWHGAILLN
jgi:hypothetical protein